MSNTKKQRKPLVVLSELRQRIMVFSKGAEDLIREAINVETRNMQLAAEIPLLKSELEKLRIARKHETSSKKRAS